jgi:hypothetical protein
MFESLLYFIRVYCPGVPCPSESVGAKPARQQRLPITAYDRYSVPAASADDLEPFDFRPGHPLVRATPGAYEDAVISDTDPIAGREQVPDGPQDRTRRDGTDTTPRASSSEERGDRVDHAAPVPFPHQFALRIPHIRNCYTSSGKPERKVEQEHGTRQLRPAGRVSSDLSDLRRASLGSLCGLPAHVRTGLRTSRARLPSASALAWSRSLVACW